MRCWGYNGYGQLGDGTTARAAAVTVPTVVDAAQISAGRLHTRIRRRDSTLMLGLQRLRAGGRRHHHQPGARGDHHRPHRRRARWWPAATTPACALTAGGVQCWGYNNAGQLGDGSVTNAPRGRADVRPRRRDDLRGRACVLPVVGGNDYTCLCPPGGLARVLGLRTPTAASATAPPSRATAHRGRPSLTGVSVALGLNHALRGHVHRRHLVLGLQQLRPQLRQRDHRQQRSPR